MLKNRLYLTSPTAPKTILAHERDRPGMLVQRWGIFHKKVGNGLFACKSFGERNAMASYIESLPYGDLEKELQVTTRYGEEYIEAAVESSRRWT